MEMEHQMESQKRRGVSKDDLICELNLRLFYLFIFSWVLILQNLQWVQKWNISDTKVLDQHVSASLLLEQSAPCPLLLSSVYIYLHQLREPECVLSM